MTRRFRLAAGIFASLAMTFSVVETVLASMCAPMPVLAASVAGESAPSADDCMARVHGQPERDGDEGTDGSPSGGFHCPFGPVAAQGCTAPALLPATTDRVEGSPSENTVAPAFETARHDLLLATPLFHPPKP
jgi:hypothetical protein